MKQLSLWTRKEFEALPQRQWAEDIGMFDSLIILPARSIHDSGYRCLAFVAVKDGVPICKLSGCSDVINFDGIGGYGFNWVNTSGVPYSIPPKGWSIDCLKKSGLLRIFCSDKLRVGLDLSSFEVYAVKERKKEFKYR